MGFHYPGGKPFRPSLTQLPHKQNTRKHQRTTYGNRGMTLEEDLTESNKFYLEMGRAVIHKKPTPVQIVSVDYPRRSAAKITEAYFKQPSTTDFNGIYRGKYIDFEAKETRNRTSFPLNNVHQHQVKHMQDVLQLGGICFIILRFTTRDTVFLYDAGHFIEWYLHQNERKSIPFSDIEEKGIVIPLGFQPRLDYLSIVDYLYFS